MKTQTKAKRVSDTLFPAKAGENVTDDRVPLKTDESENERREGSRGDRVLDGWQEERLEVDHVNNMALGSSTMPAVSLLQFKLPPQNPFAAEGASA